MVKKRLSKPQLRLLVGSWHLLEQIMAFGNPTAGGFSTMADALRAVAELNKELKARYNLEFAVSGHWWHEILVPGNAPGIGYSNRWNNPRGIALDEWMNGVKTNRFAPIGRIIPPGFGLPGADDGAFINPDPRRRLLARDMMIYSFQRSADVKAARCGLGNVIYWTGPDGIRWKRIVQGDDVRLGYTENPKLEEWNLIVNGVGDAVGVARSAGFTNEVLLIEGKAAGDPCYLDVFTDTALEVQGIRQINRVAGADVAEWQGEFCHERGAGIPFHKAMQIAIKGGVFGGRIHFNSGGLGSTNFSTLLAKPRGTPMSMFQQYVDPDFLPGEGPEEWLKDQRLSLAVGALWSARTGKPFEVEFDARFCRYENTIDALWKSALWTINTFQKEARRIATSR